LTIHRIGTPEAWSAVCTAGIATFKAVPSIKAMLEANIVDNRTQGPGFVRTESSIGRR